ncbi:unnamed protein product, partial [Amoebophrya sp. A25]
DAPPSNILEQWKTLQRKGKTTRTRTLGIGQHQDEDRSFISSGASNSISSSRILQRYKKSVVDRDEARREIFRQANSIIEEVDHHLHYSRDGGVVPEKYEDGSSASTATTSKRSTALSPRDHVEICDRALRQVSIILSQQPIETDPDFDPYADVHQELLLHVPRLVEFIKCYARFLQQQGRLTDYLRSGIAAGTSDKKARTACPLSQT